MFITAFTSAHHLSLSWARSIQSTLSHPTSWRTILILSSHLCRGLTRGLCYSGLPTITLYPPFLHATCPTHPILLGFITRIIFGEEHRSLNSTLCNLFVSCHLVPVRPKYLPQHPILQFPQLTFLPQCDSPNCTHAQIRGVKSFLKYIYIRGLDHFWNTNGFRGVKSFLKYIYIRGLDHFWNTFRLGY